jgi:polyprenyldihydroxybenzoate methyltransferase/3-demethylubiquinol 3-O-methyltransferase
MNSDELLLQRNIDPKEIAAYTPMAKEWWNTKNGPVYTLHDMNKLRIDLICDGLIATNKMKPWMRNEPNAFQGIKILGECELVSCLE